MAAEFLSVSSSITEFGLEDFIFSKLSETNDLEACPSA